MLQRMFGAAAIENLRSQFFCVSTNLTRASAQIYQEGPLWKAVRASMSMPGIGPPAIENGEIFVDGGLVNNLPVDVMKNICSGITLAVDVSEQLEFRSTLKESYSLSGWRILWQSLNPFSDDRTFPTYLIFYIVPPASAAFVCWKRLGPEADYCFSPPVQPFNVFDWHSANKIIDIGYDYALREIARFDSALSRALTAQTHQKSAVG